MDGFIEDDDDDESGRSDDADSRAAAKVKKAKRAKKASGGASGGFALAEGLTPEQRDEVFGVFGNGNDFAWAFPDEKEDRDEKLEDASGRSRLPRPLRSLTANRISTDLRPLRNQISYVDIRGRHDSSTRYSRTIPNRFSWDSHPLNFRYWRCRPISN